MKEILVSKNRPCLCNSKKNFKLCCGLNINKNVEDSFKIHYLLSDIYRKTHIFISKSHDIENLIKKFKIYYNIPQEDKTDFSSSFKFIEFVLFKIKSPELNILKELKESNIFDQKELEFLKDLEKYTIFSLYRVLEHNSKEHYYKIENIFTQEIIEFHNKLFKNINVGGLIYGREYNLIGRQGILPTLVFKDSKEFKEDHIENTIKSFKKRHENDKKNLSLKEYVNSIEYEIFGGDDPFEEYEFEKRFEEFQKKNPDKDFDDFLDEIEDELFKE